MRCDDLQLEWRINDVERTANEASGRLHELDSLRSDVDSNECALRESRSEVDGLRYELQTLQEKVDQMLEALTP